MLLLINVICIISSSESDSVEAVQCNVQIVIAPTLLERFDDDSNMAIKDVYIQLDLLNKIFLKLPLKRRGKSIRLTFHATNIVLHMDEVYSPFPGSRAHLDSFTKFTRNPSSVREICLTIGKQKKLWKILSYFLLQKKKYLYSIYSYIL